MKPAEEILAKITGQDAAPAYDGSIRPMTIRANAALISSVVALSEMSGETRTKIANALLSSGLQIIEQGMDESTKKRFHDLVIKDLQNWRKERQEAE